MAMEQAGPGVVAEAERASSTLAVGVLVVRWAGLVSMATVAVVGQATFRLPAVAWGALAVATVWTLWLTLQRRPWRWSLLGADLALGAVLLVLAGVVSAPGAAAVADAPMFISIYPLAAALTWGLVRGLRAGAVAGVVLALALFGGVLANGLPPRAWTSAQGLEVAGDGLGFVLAGAALGMVARLLDRSAAALRAAAEGEVRAVRRATRLEERESLARQLHDSVLQALALVAKRGRELAGQERVPGAAVGELAELAAAQERAVRGLLLRPLEDDDGEGSLREALDAAAATVAGTLEVSVGAVGVPPLPAGHVRELGAAVQQALANVERHAQARHAWIYAEEVEGTVVVSVRDDGVGFTYDEAALRAAGKIGLQRSMRGRIEGLGGTMLLDSAPGRGTEVEFRLPVPAPPAPEVDG